MKPGNAATGQNSVIQSSRKGFTLFELLVVVGVIAVLATMTLVTVVKAKRSARNAQCANNLRQVGLALGQFLTDNGEYPLALNSQFSTGAYTGHRTTWISALEHIITPRQGPGVWEPNQGVFNCPAAEKPSGYPESRWYSDFGYNSRGVGTYTNGPGFGLGGRYEGERGGGFSGPPVKESEVVAPAEMMVLGDGFTGWGKVIEDGVPALWRNPTAQEVAGSSNRSRQRHGDRANVYFADGHAASPTLKSMFEDTNDEALRRWHRDNQPHRERLVP